MRISDWSSDVCSSDLQKGTYKIAADMDGLFASYKLNGENKRWRGSADKLGEIPAAATEVKITEVQNRNEIFVTSGHPTDTLLKHGGQGLELQPVKHPNTQVTGEAGQFRFLMDGKPARKSVAWGKSVSGRAASGGR